MMSERYRRGVDIAQQLVVGLARAIPSTSRVAEVAPDFARMAIEFAFGDLYSRDALDLRSREIVAIAALAVVGTQGPASAACRGRAERSASREAEIVEILMQIALYGGFPAALNALSRLP